MKKTSPSTRRGGDKNKPCIRDFKGFPQVLNQEEKN
jgi:hypothetical protein